jgi:hypothetical protein
MRDIDAAQIAELHPFELFPQALARIEFGGVCRQAFHVQPLGCTIRQECLDDLTAMDGGAIPQDDHTAWDLTQQMFQKGHDIGGIDRLILTVEVQLTFRRDGADG